MADGPSWIRHASAGATIGGVIGGAAGFVAAPFVGVDPVTGAVAGSSLGGVAGGQISAWRDRRRALKSLLVLAARAEERNRPEARDALRNLREIAIATDQSTEWIREEADRILRDHGML